MSEEDKDKINNKEDEIKVDDTQPGDENLPKEGESTQSQESLQPEGDNKPEEESKPSNFDQDNPEGNNNKNETVDEVKPSDENEKKHEVIHKKDGRLHIYVRQDKYKGELKSKNWVGRLYIDGKQKIFSSGTPNLEEAIPILEKWFDDIHANKEKEQQSAEATVAPATEVPQQTEITATEEKKPEPTVITPSAATPVEEKETMETKAPSSIFEKLKNIKLKKPNLGSKDSTTTISKSGKGNFRKKLEGFFKSKLGKSSVQGEEILGVEITAKEIRLAQVSSNKANQWVLEKFFIHPVNLPEDATVVDNSEKLSEELNIALQK